MSAPFPFLSDRKSEILKNLSLVVLLMFVAFGQIPLLFSNGIETYSHLVLFVFLALTLIYIAVVYLNIRFLVPRFLLRNKYVSYIGVLFGMAVLAIAIVIFSEWVFFSIYQHPPSTYGYLSNNTNLIFRILSDLVCYLISFVATSVIIFMRHWRESGERIHELEESATYVELEKVRNKIDSGVLFDVLDKAASIAVSFPRDASRLLMDISKSLRLQLYESEHKKPLCTPTKKPKNLFTEQNTVVDFLVEKRYRPVRHLLLLLAVVIIGCANAGLKGPFQWLELSMFSVIFMAFIYVNIYVLLPQFLFKNKLIGYHITAISLIAVFIALLLPYDIVKEILGFLWIFIISLTIRLGFLFAGTTAFVIFQHWIRNERYIAQLETTTMRAELEQLQNQINPHFLFNMLNNILVLIRENPEEAVAILHKMSDMLKYQFKAGAKKAVRLNDDIHFLTDFLNLEKIRRDRFEFTIFVENDTGDILVPPLVFIPFVENAVKHSADAVNLSYIQLHFNVTDNMLHFTCRNSKPLQPRKKTGYCGLGLANIKRRLELLYDRNYSLDIREDETSYTAQLSIKI